MKKYLLLIGLLAILTFNSAKAQGYYYQNDGYYEEAPRYQREAVYQQPQYKEVQYVQDESPRYQRQSRQRYNDEVYVREESPRYRRMTNAEARQYEEKKIYKSKEPIINKIRPYIGFDVSMQKMKFGDNKNMSYEDGYYDGSQLILTKEDSFKDKNKAISFVLGAKYGQYFGAELFYQQSGEKDKNFMDIGSNYLDAVENTWSYKAYGLDLIGYLPVIQEIDLLAALGLGQYDFEGKVHEIWGDIHGHAGSEVMKKSVDSLGIRLGIGAQYNITEHVALRGMIRYIPMIDDDYVKRLVEASLGIRCMF